MRTKKSLLFKKWETETKGIIPDGVVDGITARKILLLLILIIMGIIVFGAMSASASEILYEGTCGTNLTWTLDDSGTLTISGSGTMKYWDDSYLVPWRSCRSKIIRVVLGNDVANIGNYAFYMCDRLTSVTIPDGITSIGNYAFEACTGLTSVTIPNSVTSIGYRTFFACTGLTSVTIPDSVTSIGTSAFNVCFNLININVNKNNPVYCSKNGVLFDKNETTLIQYPAKKVDTEYMIPASVNHIGNGAFHYCTNLTSITIPNGVTRIGNEAFYKCTGLRSITIPGSVTSIGSYAFYMCYIQVYYNGDYDKWSEISIGDNNTPLMNENIHYFAYVTILDENGDVIINDKFDVNSILSVPSKNGYVAKLYSDAECTNEFDIETPITTNLTLQLRYELIETKTTVSNDGKMFTILPCNIEEGNTVILALHNGEILEEVQTVTCEDKEIILTTDKAYTNAKVFVWEDLINLKPICGVEIVK